MTLSMSRTHVRRLHWTVLALALPTAAAAVLSASPGQAAPEPSFAWTTVVNNGDAAPGAGGRTFNSYNQPSVNEGGLVVFRARTRGSTEPARGIYTRNPVVAGSPVVVVADTTSLVPSPNNLDATFNEFPAFPRIGRTGTAVATRGQSTPVLSYLLADGTETRVGTSGIFATVAGQLVTGASLLGAVPGYSAYAVPGAPTGTRFDQFPGSPAVDGTTIVFKGNYSDNGTSRTGVYFRSLTSAANRVQLIADTSTRIPNQPAGGTATFGSTAPPSAAGGRTVFVGLDNERAPSLGGVYLAKTVSAPSLRTLASIGGRVPGGTTADRFSGFGEALSFDGRYVAYWGSWGTATRTITLTCPDEGNADILQYCLDHYPDGYTTTVPVQQGFFVYDTTSGTARRVVTTGTRFEDFCFWVFSGQPPGTGGGEAGSLEPPRWRMSAFVAVSTSGPGRYQVAFKARPTAGGAGVYLAAGPVVKSVATVLHTSTSGTSVDPEAPPGSSVSGVGLERDGLRGRWLAVNVSMLDPATSQTWAGVYLTAVR